MTAQDEMARGSCPLPLANGGLESPPNGDDWSNQRIGDLVVRTKQRNPASKPESRFTYIDVSAISNTSFRITAPTDMLGSEAPSRARKVVHAADVLFATVRPTLKRVALVPPNLHDQIASTGYIVLRAEPAKLNPAYLYFRLLTDEFMGRMRELERGASYPAVRDVDVLNEVIPVPSLPEQAKIAAVLSLVQQAIEQQEQLIALTAELKKALMHKLFTEGMRGEPHKETEVGPVPKSWSVVTIGSLGRVITGSTPRTEVSAYYSPAEVDFIAPADLGNTRDIYRSQKRISRTGLATVRPLPEGAVMCVCIGSSIGKVGMTSRLQSATNQQINSIVCHENHDEAFTYYLLSYLANYWRSFATFGPVPILSKGAFGNIKIAVPRTKDEEREIAAVLSASESTLEIHQRSRAILGDLFRTLLHELMTARIRVQDTSLSEPVGSHKEHHND